jgi:hypothetical protein
MASIKTLIDNSPRPRRLYSQYDRHICETVAICGPMHRDDLISTLVDQEIWGTKERAIKHVTRLIRWGYLSLDEATGNISVNRRA